MIDCDGVLVDHDPVAAAPLAQAMKARGLDLERVMRTDSDWAVKEKLLTGGDYEGEIARLMGPHPAIPAAEVADFMLRAGFVRNTPIVEELSDWARRRDIPTILCTNNTGRRKDFLLSPGGGDLGRMFDGIACSSDLGFYKPQPGFYMRAREVAGRVVREDYDRDPPKNLILLDDADYALDGAKNAGWQAVKVKGPDSIRRFMLEYDLDQALAAQNPRSRTKLHNTL